MFDFKGKKALVTGATGGIGSEISKALHQAGCELVISGTNDEKLASLTKELGSRVHSLKCDLSDSESVDKLVPDAAEIMSGVDIVVCNAGITKDNLIIRMKQKDFDDVIKINLQSSFIINKAAVKLMMKQRWGRIVNISSVVGVSGNPGQSNYCASKAALIGMSKSIASECASRGITVNCVAPGFIESAMTDKLNDDQKQMIIKNIPSGAMGAPKDIASSVVYLASEEARYVTGQTIHVNGGLLMI